MGEWLVLVALVFIYVASLARFARVDDVTQHGVTIVTLLGRRTFIPWMSVKSPIRISRVLWIRLLQLTFVNARFLSKRSSVAAWVPKRIGRSGLLSSLPSTVQATEWRSWWHRQSGD